MPRIARGHAKHQGFSLVELAIVLALAAIGTVLGGKALITRAEEQAAEGFGSWMLEVRNALLAYESKKFETLKQAEKGRTTLTVSRLKEEKFLPPCFREAPPGGNEVEISIVAKCDEATACNAIGLVYTKRHYASRFTGGLPRLDLANAAVRVMNGHGAVSWPDKPGVLRGSTVEEKNPTGEKMGVIAAVALYTPVGSKHSPENDLTGGIDPKHAPERLDTNEQPQNQPQRQPPNDPVLDNNPGKQPGDSLPRPAPELSASPATRDAPPANTPTKLGAVGVIQFAAESKTAKPGEPCDPARGDVRAIDHSDADRELVCRNKMWRKASYS